VTKTLSDLCSFADGRIPVTDLYLDNYISTENMLANKNGITRSAGLPTISQTQEYKAGDVLISNIRPYFRKIWFADRNGGCSNDVLVLRSNEDVYPNFLHYLLSNDNFFNYATATAKGTKMPRGDKHAIMLYEVPDFPFESQIIIADTLSSLDARIAINKKINHHLEQMAQAIFKSWFVNFEPTFTKLGNVIIAANTGGDAIRKTPIVDFDTGIRCVRVGDMSNKNEPSSWGFCRVSKEDFKKHQLKKGDIVVTRTASLGLNTIIWEDLSAVYNNGLIRLKPNKDCVSPLFLYLTLQQKEYFDYINRITGETSVRPNMKIDYLLNYEFNCPPVDLQNKLVDTIQSFFDRIRCNVAENLHLVTMRDTLLPRLMSGELSVADLSAK